MNNETMSPTIGALAAALAKAQGQIEGALKDSENPFFKSRYADLGSVWNACRLPLSTNGLSVVQSPIANADGIGLRTLLLHSSGEWIASEYSMKPVKTDPQSAGACLSYLRRYALAATVGVFQADDDGNSASRGQHDNEPVPERHFDERPGLLEKLGRLTPNIETKNMLRDYLRSVPNKSGVCALAPDGEIGDIEIGLLKYLIANWSTVIVKIDQWANQVPGAEMPDESAPEPSTWRNAKLPYAPKQFPHMAGKTIGELFDSEETRKYAFGLLMNYKAEPWTAKDGSVRQPNQTSIDFEAACRAWRVENGKETA